MNVSKILTLFFVVFIGAAKTKETEEPKIAIIGGGVSGLFTSRILRQDCYRNIEVFEKEERIVPVSPTPNAQGLPFDIVVILLNVWFDQQTGKMEHINKDFQHIIDDVGADVFASPNITYKNTTSDTVLPLPPQLTPDVSGFSFEKMISDSIIGLPILWEAYQLNGVKGILDSGLALPGETIVEWGERNDLQFFAFRLRFIVESFGFYPPSYDWSAAKLLADAYTTLGSLLDLLLFAGVSPDVYPEGSFANEVMERAQKESVIIASFTDGWANFWESIVELEETYGTKFHFSSEVTSLESNENKVEVHVGDEVHLFDYVIVSTNAAQSTEFLGNHPMKELYEVVPNIWRYASAIWEVPPEGVPGYDFELFGDVGVQFNYPIGLPITTTDFTELFCKPFVISKAKPVDIYFAAAFLDGDQERCLDKVMEESRAIGYGFTRENLQYSTFIDRNAGPLVSTEDESRGWYDDANNLQGVGNIFFTGATFTGDFATHNMLNYVLQNRNILPFEPKPCDQNDGCVANDGQILLGTVLSTQHTRRWASCCIDCQTSGECTGFNFSLDTKTCYLLTGKLTPVDVDGSQTKWKSGVRPKKEKALCSGRCGGKTNSGCWCDPRCSYNDDCCADVCDTCGYCYNEKE